MPVPTPWSSSNCMTLKSRGASVACHPTTSMTCYPRTRLHAAQYCVGGGRQEDGWTESLGRRGPESPEDPTSLNQSVNPIRWGGFRRSERTQPTKPPEWQRRAGHRGPSRTLRTPHPVPNPPLHIHSCHSSSSPTSSLLPAAASHLPLPQRCHDITQYYTSNPSGLPVCSSIHMPRKAILTRAIPSPQPATLLVSPRPITLPPSASRYDHQKPTFGKFPGGSPVNPDDSTL